MTTAIIFGRAKGVWDEMVAARKLARYDLVIGVGHTVCDYPGVVDHWVSFHTELLIAHWVKRRAQHGFPPVPDTNYWTSLYRGRSRVAPETAARIRQVQVNGGSSGLIAAFVALELGCTHAVLCGIPLLADAGQYDTGAEWAEAKHHQDAWRNYLPQLQDRVKSMSGWTAELLGEPTREWLSKS